MKTNLSVTTKQSTVERSAESKSWPSSFKIAPLVLALAALHGGAVFAQQAENLAEVEIEKAIVAASESGDAATTKNITFRTSVTGSGSATMFGDDIFRNQSSTQLKNAPYAATAVTEKVQTLRDGNTLRQSNSKRLYRDAAGRTRDETLNAAGEITTVSINDIAENGVLYTLKPDRKIATKLNIKRGTSVNLEQSMADLEPALRQRVTEAVNSAKLGASNIGSTTTFGSGGLGDPKVTVTRIDGVNGGNELIQGKKSEVLVITGSEVLMERFDESKHGARSDSASTGKQVKKIIVKRDGGNGADTNGLGVIGADAIGMGLGGNASELLAGAMRDANFAKSAVKSSLGSRDFYGVRAEGTLSTFTIPANAVGNQQPIVVSEEVWRSPELKLTVYSKRSDPRYGDTIYRLENIVRTEPNATLFTVPADYKLNEPAFSGSAPAVKK